MELLVLALSYLIGSFPTAYIVTKALTGVDPRTEGSKNVGGLNTYRIVSKRRGRFVGLLAGVSVALVDASKAVVSYLLSLSLAPSVALIAPMMAIFGHNYPVWLRFQGGRGVAALYGFLFFLSPLLLLPFLLIQGAVLLLTKRFAPGMMLALLTALPSLYVLGYSVPPSAVLSEFPVWLRYKEKHDLMVKNALGVGM